MAATFKNNSPSPLSEENHKVVVSLILGYDLLHHQDIKTAFYSALSEQTQQKNIKLTRGCWDIVLLLCEAHLTNAKNVVTDMCAMSSLSESTTRRALRKLQSLEIVERYNDLADRRRHYVRLTQPYIRVVNQFVNKCARDFRDLIELNDKRERMQVVEAWLEAETRLQLMVDSVPALISYVDNNQHYVFTNQRYMEWFGYQTTSISGQHMRDVLGSAIYKRLSPHIKTVLGGEKVSFELEIPYPPENSTRFVVANYIPDISSEGVVNGFISHIIDITEQKKNEENLQKNDLRFRLVTETINDVFWMSTCGVTEMVYISPAYETIWERSSASLYAKPASFLEAILPADLDSYLLTLKRYHSQGKAYECQYRIVKSNGEIRWIQEKGYPVTGKWGNKQLMTGICSDITDQKLAQPKTELLVDREHFEDFTKNTGVGLWEWRVDTHMINFNFNLTSMLGFPSDELGCVSINTWKALIHPDDRKNHQSWIEQLCTQQSSSYQCEIRMQHKSGDWLWFLEHGRISIKSSDNKTLSISGICTNITEQKNNSQRISRLLQQKELILSSIEEGIFGVDTQGKISFANPAALKMFGWEQHQLIGQQQHEVIQRCSYDQYQTCNNDCPICKALKEGNTQNVEEEIFWRRDGSSFPVQYSCTPLQDQGEIVGVVISFRDISEYQQAQQKISFLATHDALTGLPNRSFFMDSFNQTLLNAPNQQYMLALLFIDLDGFKSINEKLGHEAGDMVLIHTAKRIQEGIRKTDTVARLGSDEFVVVLDNIGDSHSASEVADKILSLLNQPINLPHNSVTVGASIGISLYPQHSKKASELLRVADQAMYHVKHSGKGQYHLATEN